ncbi:MAG TPA: nuclear transport factor 2 family protein [Opitutaceae bacterium]|jgi:hypothetical protein|nr:nuclear transport factor 2 family protein [Opitutaceae bacterium]
MSAPLTQQEITTFTADWYRKLDVHAPMVECLPMLADKDLEMRFPEATVRGWAGFEKWYQTVVRIFFDEVHTVTSAVADIRGDTATVKVVVRWEASVWKPPADKSERIVLDAYQTWSVRRSAATGRPEIVIYIVDELKYAPGSAKL